MLPFLMVLAVVGVSNALMQRQLLPPNTLGGLCLDGSPAGFYYTDAPTATSKVWNIYLSGGGACADEQSCKARAGTTLGSSKNWNPTWRGTGLSSDDPNENPDFYDSYKVRIPYCSGDTHRGQRTEANADTFGLYFSGRKNVEKILEYILNDVRTGPLLRDASHVLIHGNSAGGIGALMNVDYFAEQLPWAVVKLIAKSGFFFAGHTEDQPQQPLFPPSEYARWIVGQSGSMMIEPTINDLWDTYLSENCTKGHPDAPHMCFSATAAYPFIKAPVFILQNQYDMNQVNLQFGAPRTMNNPQTAAYYAYFGRSTRATITANFLKQGDGAFLPSCTDHGNGLGVGSEATTLIVGAPTQTELVGDWFWEGGKFSNYFVTDNCEMTNGLPCNPTCNSFAPPSDLSDGCADELRELGCSDMATSTACEQCANQHTSELTGAGCTPQRIRTLCRGAASPSALNPTSNGASAPAASDPAPDAAAPTINPASTDAANPTATNTAPTAVASPSCSALLAMVAIWVGTSLL